MIKIWEDALERLRGQIPKGSPKRSSQWSAVRNAYLVNHNRCAACGSRKRLQCHHIVPFWVDASLELSVENFITLCTNGKYGMRNCHLNIGHAGNWKRVNPDVVADAALMRMRLGWAA